MNLLAIDTATTGCSAAYQEGGRILAHRAAAMARGQSESLMPMIADVLADAGRAYGDLQALAVTVGPGAFTGMRIGLAAARGLALALAIPVIGVTTLEALAHGVPEAKRRDAVVLAVLDSKRADVYAQAFADDGAALTEAAALHEDGVAAMAGGLAELGDLVIVGDAEQKVLDVLGRRGIAARSADAPAVPDAAVVAVIAAGRGMPVTIDAPAPLYLRPPDATVPAHGGRLRP